MIITGAGPPKTENPGTLLPAPGAPGFDDLPVRRVAPASTTPASVTHAAIDRAILDGAVGALRRRAAWRRERAATGAVQLDRGVCAYSPEARVNLRIAADLEEIAAKIFNEFSPAPGLAGENCSIGPKEKLKWVTN
jgi:hypothetical protein